MTTMTEIGGWFLAGQKNGYAYMIVATDTFDYEDYPVYIKAEAGVDDTATKLNETITKYRTAPMSKVMEVYDLNQPMTPQLNQRRCWSVPNQ